MLTPFIDIDKSINHLSISINHLSISINHLSISVIDLSISVIHLSISVIHLSISINRAHLSISINELPISINGGELSISINSRLNTKTACHINERNSEASFGIGHSTTALTFSGSGSTPFSLTIYHRKGIRR